MSPRFLLYSTINLFSEASFWSLGTTGLATTGAGGAGAAVVMEAATGAATTGGGDGTGAKGATIGVALSAATAAAVTATPLEATFYKPLVGSSKNERPIFIFSIESAFSLFSFSYCSLSNCFTWSSNYFNAKSDLAFSYFYLSFSDYY